MIEPEKSEMNDRQITTSKHTTGGGHGGITVEGMDYVPYDACSRVEDAARLVAGGVEGPL